MQPANHDRGAASARDFPLEELLGAASAALPEGILVIDPRGIVQFANAAAEQLFGFRRGELTGTFLGLLITTLTAEQTEPWTPPAHVGGISRKQAGRWAAEGRRKDGSMVLLHGTCSELDGRPGSITMTLHEDSTEHRVPPRAELASLALDRSPFPTLMVTSAGKIAYANAAFLRLAGWGPDIDPTTLPDSDEHWLGAGQELADALSRWSSRKDGDSPAETESITAIRNEQGEITHFLLIDHSAAADDPTRHELEQSEQRFRKVAQMAGEWLWEQDPHGRYTYSSAAVFDILGYRPEEMQGKYYLDVLTPEDRKHWTDALPTSPNIPRPFHRLTNRYAHRDGHEVFTESTGEPLLDANGDIVKWWGVDHDITERKRIEDALRLRDRAIAAADVGIAILDARQPGFPLIYANPAFCRLTGYPEQELLNRAQPFIPDNEIAPDCLATLRTALHEGSSCAVTLQLERRDRSTFWSDLLMSAVHDETGRVTHFIWIVTDITERKRAAEARQELETARKIQSSLLPKSALRTDGVEAAGVFLPAGAVGGDYFDYFVTPEGINATIADVSGHNVGAALIMTETRSALRTKTLVARNEQRRDGPAQVLAGLNELLFDDLNGAELFITMLYLEFDLATRRLTYANAGHNPGILVRPASDHSALLDAEGLVLGVRQQVPFEERSLLLKAGDVVLLYTDGVIEARDGQGELFGTERLTANLMALAHLPVEELIQRLIDAVHAFAGRSGLVDDTSMVALKIL